MEYPCGTAVLFRPMGGLKHGELFELIRGSAALGKDMFHLEALGPNPNWTFKGLVGPQPHIYQKTE